MNITRVSTRELKVALQVVLALAILLPATQLRAKPAGSQTASDEPRLTAEQWRADLRFFASEMEKKHLNAFHYTTREHFEAEVAALDARIPQLDADGVYVGLQRLASLVGDGHTYVRIPQQSTRYFPLLIRRFGEDYYIAGVGPGLESALGMKLAKIEDTPVTRVAELLRALTPQDEPGLAPVRIPGFMTFANMLHGLGIIPTRDSARYSFVDDSGREFSLAIQSVPGPDLDKIEYVRVMKQRPLYLQKLQESLWFTYLSDYKTVYCQFQSYEHLAERGKALMDFVKEQQPEKLVIDLRLNGGGDFFEGLRYLIQPIRNDSSINKRGHLFVIIGPATFSAALANATHFRKQTAAVLVGEPIGEKPNSYSEPRNETLPNSHYVFRYQTQFYKFGVEGGENLVRPDQEIITKWEEYKSGRDPVLEWILKYEAK